MTAAAAAGGMGIFSRMARLARRAVDAVAAGVVVALLGAGAIVAAIAAFALAAFMALGVAAMWIVGRVFGARFRRRAQAQPTARPDASQPAADGEPVVLNAQRGAHGWSVAGSEK